MGAGGYDGKKKDPFFAVTAHIPGIGWGWGFAFGFCDGMMALFIWCRCDRVVDNPKKGGSNSVCCSYSTAYDTRATRYRVAASLRSRTAAVVVASRWRCHAFRLVFRLWGREDENKTQRLSAVVVHFFFHH